MHPALRQQPGCVADTSSKGIDVDQDTRTSEAGSTPPGDVRDWQRFWSKVELSNVWVCWHWTGAKYVNNYGCFSVKSQKFRAHRFAYELLVGPIPEGLVLDHLCRDTLCVNPAHLDPVTITENVRRGAGPPGRAWTHCKFGHELQIRADGHRRCVVCAAERSRRWAKAHRNDYEWRRRRADHERARRARMKASADAR